MAITDKFIIKYPISIYHCIMSWLMPRVMDDRRAIIRHYSRFAGGRKPNGDQPVLFSEKLQWYKLHDRSELMPKVSNKYTLRQYVQDCGHPELLNEVLGLYTSAWDIDFDGLPQRFVLKGTHGSGFNIIVKDKSKLNKLATRLMLDSWLRQSIAWSGREWVYDAMPRHILAEKYLQDESGELRDYKFYCFNGEPRFMQLEDGRDSDHNSRNFYDMDWNLLPFGKGMPHNPSLNLPRPHGFERMQQLARELSKPFQYVRVDFYLVNEKIYIGEMTFFPAGGMPDFTPTHYDRIVGDMWKLKKYKQQ